MRHEDWATRLAAFIAQRYRMPFQWAANDCATFAADWIEQATGERRFSPPYTDAMSAARLVESEGGMAAAASHLLGLGDPMEHPRGARRGDIALVNVGGRETLAVVDVDGAFGPGPDGLMHAPRTAFVAAWAV